MLAQISWQNVADNDGVAVALTGMVIVFSALTLITLFISVLPRALQVLAPILPAEHHGHGPGPAASGEAGIDEELVAVAAAFHQHYRS